jgi:hypothetical protein
MSDVQIRQLDKKMDRVLLILENDHGTGKKGLVARVDDLQKDFDSFITKYESDRAYKKGKQTVWSIVFGFVGAAFWKLLTLIF